MFEYDVFFSYSSEDKNNVHILPIFLCRTVYEYGWTNGLSSLEIQSLLKFRIDKSFEMIEEQRNQLIAKTVKKTSIVVMKNTICHRRSIMRLQGESVVRKYPD